MSRIKTRASTTGLPHGCGARIHYMGDVNPEYGGYLYVIEDEGAEVVQITPCTDAGGPENCFWVEHKSVDLAKNSKRYHETCKSFDLNPESCTDTEYLYAALGYGNCDQNTSVMVRIGGPDPYYGGRDKFEPDEVLPANAVIFNYALKMAKEWI